MKRWGFWTRCFEACKNDSAELNPAVALSIGKWRYSPGESVL